MISRDKKSLTKGVLVVSANVVMVGEELLRKDIEYLARKAVEETLNAPLDEAAFEPVGAESRFNMAKEGLD